MQCGAEGHKGVGGDPVRYDGGNIAVWRENRGERGCIWMLEEMWKRIKMKMD